MTKYVCKPCGYVYDPEVGDKMAKITPGTTFEELPDYWVCPMCGAKKNHFMEEDLCYAQRVEVEQCDIEE